MSLSKKQHKELLDQTLQSNITYKSIHGVNPCSIMIDGITFNVYIKNLSSAYFKNPDVSRAQLPRDEEFVEMKSSSVPFVYLGYDEVNDVYATWNPHMVKQRLNEAVYVSFYSRFSLQEEAHNEDKFIRKELNNDAEVLIFPRAKLSSYLVNIQTYFTDMSEYVAIGSKRRTEANDAYRELTNSKNTAKFAKFLRQKGCNNITEYCRMLKRLITDNYFSIHRKDFLAFDSINEYVLAVDRFMENEDVKIIDAEESNCLKDMLLAYVEFLQKHVLNVIAETGNEGEKNDVNTKPTNVVPVATSHSGMENEEQYLRDGKILKVVNSELLHEIEPHMNTDYQEPLPAIAILESYYSKKYDLKMEMKDWMKLVQGIDWNTCYTN